VTDAADPFASLATMPRWLVWREELRAGRATKVPYVAFDPGERWAKTDDPRTWAQRPVAEAATPRLVNGCAGGIGVVLGELGNGEVLIGIDLDTCLANNGPQPWAAEVIQRVATYVEISPSQTGVKAFGLLEAADLPALRARMRSQHGRAWKKRSGGEHPPAIELHVSNRYFAVTRQPLPGAAAGLRRVPLDALQWLIEEAGPRLACSDKSRSAAAWRTAQQVRGNPAATIDDLRAALESDPQTADWLHTKGEANAGRELHRLWDRATPHGATAAGDVPTIRVTGGLLHVHADAGLAALRASDVGFYQRDRALVRTCLIAGRASDGTITMTPGVIPVTPAMLRRALGSAARWEKLNSKGEVLRINPPMDAVEQIADMLGTWSLPVIAGVIATPTLRPDGSVLATEGYDSATGLVLLASPVMPAIPDHPTWHDAEAALTVLNGLLAEFPFVDGPSRSVAMSMLITPVVRGALAPAVPFHVVSAPQPGTGKSYLADIAAAIATGQRCAVTAASSDPLETEKRLVAAALSGFPIISLDNCTAPLDGAFLCQLIERPSLDLRPLGASAIVRVPNVFSVLGNGNNVLVSGDVVRRTLFCSLDAGMEAPELRSFAADPVRQVLADRGHFVAAALTIARAYAGAGRPGRSPPLLSFAAWSDTVRSALVWLGWDDPVATLAQLRSDDPRRASFAAVLAAWPYFLDRPMTCSTAELIGGGDRARRRARRAAAPGVPRSPARGLRRPARDAQFRTARSVAARQQECRRRRPQAHPLRHLDKTQMDGGGVGVCGDT